MPSRIEPTASRALSPLATANPLAGDGSSENTRGGRSDEAKMRANDGRTPKPESVASRCPPAQATGAGAARNRSSVRTRGDTREGRGSGGLGLRTRPVPEGVPRSHHSWGRRFLTPPHPHLPGCECHARPGRVTVLRPRNSQREAVSRTCSGIHAKRSSRPSAQCRPPLALRNSVTCNSSRLQVGVAPAG
jgi:hypothetical protein